MARRMKKIGLAKMKRAPGKNVVADAMTAPSQFVGVAAAGAANFPRWMGAAKRKGKKR